MSELEDKINSLLSSPEEMGKIAALAQSLMGSGIIQQPDSAADESPVESVSESSDENPLADMLGSIDPNMIANIGKAMSGIGGGSDKQALLQAMTPYLGEKRREKMRKAIQLAQMAKVAKAVFAVNGGGSD